MARSATNSSATSAQAEPDDDKNGLTLPRSDDVLPDDHGGTLGSIQPSTVNSGHGSLARFFDTKTGGHFFTSSATEQATLLAARPELQLEGNSFSTDDFSTAGASEVHRFFSTTDGGHFFTASAVERDTVLATRSDLTYEGVAFHEHAAPQAGYVPVWRFFERNDGGHLFTASGSEHSNLVATRSDLVDEGVAFYAPAT